MRSNPRRRRQRRLIAKGFQRIRARHRRRGGDFFAGGLHRPQGRHGDKAALGVSGQEQLSVIAGGRHEVGQRGARSREYIHHLARLLDRIDERVIPQGGNVVAGVVRRHDDVALRREHRRNQRAFGVRWIRDVGNIERLVGLGAVRILDDRSQTRAGGRGTGRHHQRARGLAGLTGAADGPEFEIVEIHAARGIARELQQLLAGCSRGGDLCLQGRRIQRGDAQRRIHRQRAGSHGSADRGGR